jgi:hypothetical protein
MSPDEPEARGSNRDHPAALHRVRLPGFTAETEVGLGDVIKRATSAVGIRPCGTCRKRTASLNRYLVFSGRR